MISNVHPRPLGFASVDSLAASAIRRKSLTLSSVFCVGLSPFLFREQHMCEEEMAVHQESPMENVFCDVLVMLHDIFYHDI